MENTDDKSRQQQIFLMFELFYDSMHIISSEFMEENKIDTICYDVNTQMKILKFLTEKLDKGYYYDFLNRQFNLLEQDKDFKYFYVYDNENDDDKIYTTEKAEITDIEQKNKIMKDNLSLDYINYIFASFFAFPDKFKNFRDVRIYIVDKYKLDIEKVENEIVIDLDLRKVLF